MGHVAGLGLLLSQNHHRNRPRALRVYGPRGTRGKVQRLLLDSFILPEELSYKLKITNVKPNKIYEEALLRIKFFKTEHLEQPRLKTQFGSKAVACGLVVDGPGWRIVYGGDVASPQELSPYLQGCDLLIYGIADHQPQAVAELIAAADVPHVLITHLGSEFSEAPEKLQQAFAGRYHGDLIVAEDGTRIRLSEMRENANIEIIR
jgi:ribonuclease BN (tRNA processing enzyme)